VSGREFDYITVMFVRSEGLVFLDLRWDGGITAKIPGDVILDKLWKYRIFDDDSALRWSGIPVIGLRTIPINDGGIGRCVNEVGESFNSTSTGIENAGEDVESNGSHIERVIADSAFVS